MGINIELRQHGPRPRKGRPKTVVVDEVVDDDEALPGLLAKVYGKGRTPMFDRVDPYADVTFSSAEAARLVDELQILAAAAQGETEISLLAGIERLARKCVANPSDHRLHFIGD
jgi:hypothetical protein